VEDEGVFVGKGAVVEQLSKIQEELKAPKGQFNKFGKYSYRSCEDILTAVKPLLGKLALTITDDIVMVGNRIYVKATATVTDGVGEVAVTGFAREADNKKGMDDSQLTGSCSSYARKYALNGLFCIDDTKDADSTNNHGKAQPQQQAAPQPVEDTPCTEMQKTKCMDLLNEKNLLTDEVQDRIMCIKGYRELHAYYTDILKGVK
jgi:hypothetical protein